METVTSHDGTTIAYDRDGQGPVVILINGALGDRALDRKFKQMTVISELLSPQFTVINYDRRGRGDSTDARPFDVQREIEDIAALITALGGRASLFGFSSGGALALRAAGAAIGIDQVAVYETPFVVNADDKRPSADYGQRLDALIAHNDQSGAVTHFMRNAMSMPAPAVAAMRLMPVWKLMKANAPTLRYDWAALAEHNMQGRPLRTAEWASVTMPVLVVYGAKSPSSLRNGARALAEVLPDAELRELAGMGHRLKVNVLAPVLAEFFGRHTGDADSRAAGRTTA